MSNLFAAGSSRDQGRALPRGEVVGRYTAYLDAQKAVDYLADSKFAVQNVSIVGNDLKTVERVTGRLSYPRVALSSALTGAWFGLFVGLVLSLFGGAEALGSIGPIIALGAVFWLLFGVIGYALQRGRRDFTSTSQVIATTYDVVVAPEAAGEARQLLARLPMNGQAGHPAPQPGPGRYGQPGQGPYPHQGQGPYGQPGPGQYGQPGPGQYGQPGQQGQGQYGQPGQQGQPGQGRPGPAPHPSGNGSGPYGAPGQPGQAPQRPAGWHDPYSSPAGSSPAAPGSAGAPAAPGTPAANPAAVEAAAGSADAPRRGQFPDLPDGRPRYGIRLDAEGRPIAPRPAGSAAPSGSGPSGSSAVTSADTATDAASRPVTATATGTASGTAADAETGTASGTAGAGETGTASGTAGAAEASDAATGEAAGLPLDEGKDSSSR